MRSNSHSQKKLGSLFFRSAAFIIFTGLCFIGFSNKGLADDMQRVGQIEIDRTEVTIGEFRKFVKATNFVTKAEKDRGGLVYELGWTKKIGWNWSSPYGDQADDAEPVVHVTFDEAQEFCKWSGKRLPTDKEWKMAAYHEMRVLPTHGFQRGQRYPFPKGERPFGANCLDDCGLNLARDRSAMLNRGRGHALTGTTRQGVNGLFDMGANVWEWVDIADQVDKGTLGGFWWYGSTQMQENYNTTKPRGMAVLI
ncbi:MAG: formylglycine-generating enzyme family protein [Pseudomonadota bacterium]|nr:formylglycine-generating enzyme family protein [Pseudomonadota bacterium]